ncbi:MAG: myxococcus cysteine-rich repeat containing protein [Myxococcota bacterium]
MAASRTCFALLLSALVSQLPSASRAGNGTCDAICAAHALFGTTQADGNGDVDLVVIDPNTGAATYDFTFNVGAGNLTFNFVYHDTLDRYVVMIYNPTTTQVESIGILDRSARDLVHAPISGLPGPAPDLGNFTYAPASDMLLASFAPDDDAIEDQLVEFSVDGSAGMTSTAIGEDMDGLAVRRTTGQVFGWDSNAIGGPRLFELTTLFPTLTSDPPLGLANRANLGSLAADPASDAFWVIDRTADSLVLIDGNLDYVDVGPFGHTAQIRSIFFGPATFCGDAIVDPDEGCDDGNTTSGDGCDELCEVEIPVEACPGAVALAGELSAKVGLQFAKPAKDKLQLKGKRLALPAGLTFPAAIQLDLGGVVLDAALDEKGRYKSTDGRDKVKLKQSKKDGSWKLSAKRKKTDLGDALADEGLVDEDNPKPGKPATLGLCLAAGGQNHGIDLPVLYRSKLGKSGKAK